MDSVELRNMLLQAFLEEAPELLQKAEIALLDLEEAGAVGCKQHCDSLKRSLHSLKGSASAIGNHPLRDVCHTMEDLLLFIADNGASPKQLDALHIGLDFLQAAAATPGDDFDASAVLSALLDPDALQNTSLDPGALQNTSDVITSTLTDNTTDSSTSTSVSVSQPTPKQTPAPLAISEQPAQPVTDTIRVSIGKIDTMQSNVGELVAIRLQQNDSLVKLKELQHETTSLTALWRTLTGDIREARQKLPAMAAVKLDRKTAALSTHLKKIERQILHLSHQMSGQTGQLGLLCDAMDMGLRAVRMMPLGPFLESYRSAARDAARMLNKSVVLECDDKGIEVDRLILERIKEPLLHLVRNAVSHGIEPPEQRLSSNKPEAGNIRLSAELNGEYVSIAVMDDGAGFSLEKIRQKAVALGLLHADEVLPEEKIIDIVSHSGFSTSSKADMVSGRGIGMDVVSTMVAELGGTIDLETFEGGGSCITLRVPSSLATAQGLILQVGTQRYGILLDMVERIVRSRLDQLDTIEGKEVLYLDESPIAVASLASIFELSAHLPRRNTHTYPIVILRFGSWRLALIVDDIPGEIPMIVKSLGPQFEKISIYAGGAILPDGSVLPVLEARQLIHRVSNRASAPVGSEINQSENESEFSDSTITHITKTILVVDDSITTRTLERNILEAAGYRVLVATDGSEAADILRVEDAISLLVTDLEMPRMNGIELCQHVRSSKNNNLPIIMVTSVGNESEKQKGLTAGADAYIVKGNFQQDYFLATVRRFIGA